MTLSIFTFFSAINTIILQWEGLFASHAFSKWGAMERIKLLLLSTVITKREKTQASAFSKGIGLYFLSVETSGYGSQAVRLGKDSLQVKRTFSY